MRFLVILAASLLCLAPCKQGIASETGAGPSEQGSSWKPGPVRVHNRFPTITVINDTEKTHYVDVDYARGFKRLQIGGKVQVDKIVYDGKTYESVTTGKVIHKITFNPPPPSRKPFLEDIHRYEIAVYEKGSEEKMCSSIIRVAPGTLFSGPSASDGAGTETSFVGEGNCIATVPQNSACTMKAKAFGPTCQVELTISE